MRREAAAKSLVGAEDDGSQFVELLDFARGRARDCKFNDLQVSFAARRLNYGILCPPGLMSYRL